MTVGAAVGKTSAAPEATGRMSGTTEMASIPEIGGMIRAAEAADITDPGRAAGAAVATTAVVVVATTAEAETTETTAVKVAEKAGGR